MSRETTFDRDLHAPATGPNSRGCSPSWLKPWRTICRARATPSRTIGIKLQRRNQEVSQVNSDLLNFSLTVDIPILRLDLERRIRLLGVRAGTLVRSRDLPAAADRAADDERELFSSE